MSEQLKATSVVPALIDNLERVRKHICCYMGSTCDCKYGVGVDTRPGTEATGCPEIRDAIGFLRQLQKIEGGERLLTYQEWEDVQRVMRGFSADVSEEAKRRG